MKKAPYLIPEAEFWARLEAIIPPMVKAGSADSSQQLRELFNLHNDRHAHRETNIACGACRERVFNRMREIYNNYKNGTN